MQLYNSFKAMGLNLDMSRGKPCKEQLDLSNGMLDVLNSTTTDFSKPDYRNYGLVDGAPEAKSFFAELCGVFAEEIMVLGNASLNIMYDSIQRGMQFGFSGKAPMNAQGKLKWLCPVPGYDRHFAVTQLFGFEMINIPMTADGPDMDAIEKLVSEDETVKGIWCVPKYSNPQGVVYSDATVKRFAALSPKAADFRIYWDNAYMVHHLGEDITLLNLLGEAKKNGKEDMVFMFGSTSKITFAGAGVSFMCASKANIDYSKKLMTIQSIGPDKLNQLSHIRYFGSVAKLLEHMQKHSALLKPKFDVVERVLTEELAGFAVWLRPTGGYFVSCNLKEGTAKRTVELAKQAGVIFTPAGATYPYGKDPADRNIRIAPTLPPI
ncbi:MAG: aminotransferase, partial [Clostridia bacterium]|nr:aminotransferase [Clostridia bacterium]